MHQAVGQPACLAVLFGGGRLRGGRPVLHRPERARPEVGDIALVYGQVDQTVHHGARLRGPLLARLPPCKHGHRRQRHAHGEGIQVLVPAGAGPDPVGNRDRLPGPAPQRQIEEPVRADASAQPRDPLRLDVQVLIAAADHAHERHGELELRLHVGIADAVAQQSWFDAEDAHEVDLAVRVGVGRLRERIDHLPRALSYVERVGYQRLVALALVGRHRRGGRLGVDVRDRIARLPVRVQVVAGLAAVEVGVVMQDGDGGSDCDGCDEAVDEAPKGVAFPATAAKQGGRLVVVCGCRRKHGRTRKQAAQASQVVLVSGTGKHLHPDRITDRRSGPSQKLHPCRGVDQDHGLRLDRNSSMSPSQPDPRIRRACSTTPSPSSAAAASRLVHPP